MALLAIGMTLVIATGGIDLSVGAVMAIAGATAASMTVAGHSLPVVLLAALAAGALAGLWNGILVAVLKIQPFVATLILMVAGRGVAQLITAGQIVTFDSPAPGVARQRIVSAVSDAGDRRRRYAAAVLAVYP